MPILKREPDVYPGSLFELPLNALPWWVAHVRSRQEKGLSRYLHHFEVPFYLPVREQNRRRDGRTVTSFLPLFPGYVFFRGTREDRLRALQSELLVRVIDVRDQAELEQELRQLHALQEMGLPMTPHPYLGPGAAVRILEGPFAEYRGVVLRAKGKARLVVSVTMLQRSVAVELNRENLERFSSPRVLDTVTAPSSADKNRRPPCP